MVAKSSKPKKPTKKGQHAPKHHRFWKWVGGILAGLVMIILVVLLWFRLSPWPGAMLVRWVFDSNSRPVTQALEKHEPKSGIVTLSDQQYIPGGKDALLDVHFPESAQKNNQKLPLVIWTHGGAWVSGNKTTYAPYFKLLAQKGYVVIAPNYSLAPQETYPKPIHQLNKVYEYVQANTDRFYADTDSIVLAGDSAGSQLSAQMAAIITNPAYARKVGIVPTLKPGQLKGVVLSCGIYKMEELARPGADVAKILIWGDQEVVWAYSGTRDFSAPVIRQMSPYYHITKDFPPTFITGGNDDPLTDVQSKPLASELERMGVSVTRLFYPKDHQPPLPHEYQFNLDTDDGKKAFEQIVDFLNKNT